MPARKSAQSKGIANVYVGHAKLHIENRKEKGTLDSISRAQVELEILHCLDTAPCPYPFPIEMKISFHHAILYSSEFNHIWDAAVLDLNLLPSQTARYVAVESLREVKNLPKFNAYKAKNERQNAAAVTAAATSAKVVKMAEVAKKGVRVRPGRLLAAGEAVVDFGA